MRKRSLLLFTACMLAAGMLAGCSSGSEETAAATTQAPQTAAETEAETETETESSSAESEETTSGETTSEETGAEEASAEGGEGKTLVVYFSATGNTERVAQVIAETTGGDLFELEPAAPYTDEDLNYNDDNSRVSQEYADESLRDVELVASTVEGFDEYDNVFIRVSRMVGDCRVAGKYLYRGKRFYRENGDSVLYIRQLRTGGERRIAG